MTPPSEHPAEARREGGDCEHRWLPLADGARQCIQCGARLTYSVRPAAPTPIEPPPTGGEDIGALLAAYERALGEMYTTNVAWNDSEATLEDVDAANAEAAAAKSCLDAALARLTARGDAAERERDALRAVARDTMERIGTAADKLPAVRANEWALTLLLDSAHRLRAALTPTEPPHVR